MKTANKPWLNAKGEKLPDIELRAISKNWGPKVWEEYLKSIEAPQTDKPISNIDKIPAPIGVASHLEVYKALLAQDDYPELKKVVMACLSVLSDSEQEVIKTIYWQGLSLRETASALGISKNTVVTHRDRALLKLSDLLLGGALQKGVSFLQCARRGYDKSTSGVVSF